MENYQAIITCSAVEAQHIRHFSVGKRITTDRLTHVFDQPQSPGSADPSSALTDLGAQTVNKLLAVEGVVKVTTYPTEVCVTVREELDGEAMESVFLQIIKTTLFPGVVFRTKIREVVA